MKKRTSGIAAMTVVIATLSSCANSSNSNTPVVNTNTANANANVARTTPTPSAMTDLGQVLASASSSSADRVKAIDAYVSDVEAKLPSLSRKEKDLKAGDLKGVTEASLEKIHAYYDGQNLKRVKTYPTGSSRKTEEFYFYNDKLVFVFVEAEGAGKTGDDRGAKGERLYFGNDGLFAWYGEDGKAKDPAGSEFKTMGGKLTTEALAFRKLAG